MTKQRDHLFVGSSSEIARKLLEAQALVDLLAERGLIGTDAKVTAADINGHLLGLDVENLTPQVDTNTLKSELQPERRGLKAKQIIEETIKAALSTPPDTAHLTNFWQDDEKQKKRKKK